MDALNSTNEQPMSKRQKIDASENNKKGAFSAIFGDTGESENRINGSNTQPITNHEQKRSTNVSANSEVSSSSVPTLSIKVQNSSSTSPSGSTKDELDHVAVSNIITSTKITNHFSTENGGHYSANFPDMVKNSPSVASTSSSQNEIYTSTLTSSYEHWGISPTNETSSILSAIDSNNFSCLYNAEEFHSRLMNQCLCDIEKSVFPVFHQRICSEPKIPLMEWPANVLIQCLSNMELLFEIYLNQNAKGEICQRIMMACDLILWQKQIIYEIAELDEYNNKFVQYMSTKVLANCLLIVKDQESYCEDLLNSLMDKLITRTDQSTEHRSLGKMSFILGIILHIMEWKDIKKHPLDDQIVINGREVYNDSDNEIYSLPINIPRIEENYFAVQSETEAPEVILSSVDANERNSLEHDHQLNPSNDSQTVSCRLKYLKDSESFDSNELKISILKKLKTKWHSLVFKIRSLLQSNRNLNFNENAVITFLSLWERIISVDSCIEYESTLPFHLHLHELTRILIDGRLPTQIYKQILTLFSASLCYTTTLALQPEVPQATTDLATQLFNSAKDNKKNIFSSLPTHEIEPENNISFIGYKHSTIVYDVSLHRVRRENNENQPMDSDDDDEDSEGSEIELDLYAHFNKSIDFTLLQKLVLLVLKAIAVTVRPIGGDSSDSSMDSCSSSSSIETVENDWTHIEQVTKDTFEKMQAFLRNKLSFHPEEHFSKVIVHLFSNQDDYLLEAMLCMLGTTIAFLPRQPPFGTTTNRQTSGSSNERPILRMLIEIISPVYTFLEFLELIQYGMQPMLDFLITDETCFLLYFLRFLKYIRSDWTMFQNQCNKWHSSSSAMRTNNHSEKQPYKRVMNVLIQLRLKLDRLVFQRLFPYDITPLLQLMRQCESLYEGNYGLC